MHWDLTVWVDRRSDNASDHVALADVSFSATQTQSGQASSQGQRRDHARNSSLKDVPRWRVVR